MFSFWTILGIILLYFAFLYFLASWAENQSSSLAQTISNSSFVYALSLAVYCSTWTFYGSVELATQESLNFLPIYIGPALVFIFGGPLIRRLIILKNRYSISNLSDLVTVRFSNSTRLSALVTTGLTFGMIPYLALQLKVLEKTTALIVRNQYQAEVENWIGPTVIVLLAIFTIIYGLKNLDQTRRHRGLVVSLAFEQILKLVAFLAVGIYIVYGLFDGFSDIFGKAKVMNEVGESFKHIKEPGSSISWVTMTLVSASAILFLPRQFQITIVENSDAKKVLSAMWKFPLYLFLINIFVLPIALAGILKGLPISTADSFVLSLPQLSGANWLALLVYLGGFSAAVGMIMIETVALSTMITNNLLLPVIEAHKVFEPVRKRLLEIRWMSVLVLLLASYFYYRSVGYSYALVGMGLISFVAVMQLAPSVLIGVFSKIGTKSSALSAISVGFFLWFYTLFLPAFSKSGLISSDWLLRGPFGIVFLKPQALFGLSGLDPITHSVIWTMGFNVLTYFLVSSFSEATDEEYRHAVEFLQVGNGFYSPRSELLEYKFSTDEKLKAIRELLLKYLPVHDVQRVMDSLPLIKDSKIISVLDFNNLKRIVESHLAGAIGTAAAAKAVQSHLVSEEERKKLKEIFSEIISRSKTSPDELFQRIDFHQEKQKILEDQAQLLTERLRERDLENEKKTQELSKVYQQLVQSSKMSALGEMASGIAHEINNPLTVIAFKSSQLQAHIAKADISLLDAGLKKIEETAYRIAKIIKGLQSFSRNSDSDPFELVSIQSILGDVTGLCGEKFKKNNVDLKISPYDDFLITCRPTQIAQVILNLLNNAFDAVNKKQDKWVQIDISRLEDVAEISITDSGSGIPPEIASKMMQPFFTTKEVGKGTGLGLSISKGIVDDHRGQLYLNKENSHTQFVVHIPISKHI